MRSGRLSGWLLPPGLALLAFLAGVLILESPRFLDLGEMRRILWIPSGILTGLILLRGPRLWPLPAAVAFATTFAAGGGWFFSLGVALGNTAEPLLAWWLLDRSGGFRTALDRVRDVVRFLWAAVLAGPAAGALFSVGAFLLETGGGTDLFARLYWNWMQTHALGVLLIAPALMVPASAPRGLRRLAGGEGIGVVAGAVVASLLTLGSAPGASTSVALAYAPVPFLIWGAFRFGPPGAVVTSLAVLGPSVWGAVSGAGPLGDGPVSSRLLEASFIGLITSSSALLLAASVMENRASRALHARSDASWRALFDQAEDGAFVLDPGGAFEEGNPGLLRLAGVSLEALRRERFGGLFLPRPGEGAERVRRAVLEGSALRTEWMLSGPGGRRVPVEVTTHRIEGGRIQGFVRDLGERRLLMERIAQSGKLEAAGTVASGIAHDFNNLLTAILGHAEEAEERIPEDSAAREELRQLRRRARSASELAHRLLDLARPRSAGALRVVEVGERIRDARGLIAATLPRGVDLVLDLPDSEARVLIDPVQLEQVLLNLVLNARDAMGPEGTLTIGIGRRFLERMEELPPPGGFLEPGEYVAIRVRDTGRGIDPSLGPRIFLPFVTTKAEGEGRGIGLATAFHIVREAGGGILVDSVPGVGAEFRILLPATDLPVDHRPEVEAPEPGPSRVRQLEGATSR